MDKYVIKITIPMNLIHNKTKTLCGVIVKILFH